MYCMYNWNIICKLYEYTLYVHIIYIWLYIICVYDKLHKHVNYVTRCILNKLYFPRQISLKHAKLALNLHGGKKMACTNGHPCKKYRSLYAYNHCFFKPSNSVEYSRSVLIQRGEKVLTLRAIFGICMKLSYV